MYTRLVLSIFLGWLVLKLKITAFLIALIMFSIIDLTISKSYANDRYEHSYQETVYQSIPEKFIKIKARFLTWRDESLSEIQRLRSTTHPKVVAWREAIRAIRPKDDVDLMQQINAITNNAVTYIDDYAHYQKDYWAPPYETLTEGGDCEDLALLKVAALYMHKWPVKQKANILVGYIQSNGREIAHAVLEVDIGGQRYVLRNFTNEVIKIDNLYDLMKPVYMVNMEHLVVFNKTQRLTYFLSDNK